MDGTEAAIEERLRRLEDREEIRRLVQEYRRHLDARDLESYSLLFAGDGEWHGGTGYGRGPDAIHAMLADRLPSNPGPPGPTSWHVVADPEIELAGDRASGTVTWALVERGDGDMPVLKLLGHYDDTYVREDGRWRFQRRVAHVHIPHRPLSPDGPAAAGQPGGSAHE